MAESAGAWRRGVPRQLRGHVVDHIVGVSSSHSSRHVIEVQRVARLPGDDMVGTRCVAADAQSSHQDSSFVVECEPTAENVDAADLAPHHRIVRLAVVGGISIVSSIGRHRITLLQAEQRATGLDRRVKIGGGQRESWQAKGIGGVGLLRGNDPAARPLRLPIGARENLSRKLCHRDRRWFPTC